MVGIGGGSDNIPTEVPMWLHRTTLDMGRDDLVSRPAKGQVDAARNWTAVIAVPGRVVEVGQSIGLGTDTQPILLLSAFGLDARSIICAYPETDEWACFRQGYRDFGGRPEWEAHFVDDVLPCESDDTRPWDDTYPYFLSKAQFDPGSWATASRNIGLYDYFNPYHVGAAVAWWSNNIEHPGGVGGWPECWWRGRVP